MAYAKVGWKNGASGGTPINAANLEHMDAQILQNANDIATLNSNSIKWKTGVTDSINYSNHTNEIWINYTTLEGNAITKVKGFPVDAYGYGTLITIFTGQAFKNIQIYIPHSGTRVVNRPIYFRTLGDGSSNKGEGTSWRAIQGTTIDAY